MLSKSNTELMKELALLKVRRAQNHVIVPHRTTQSSSAAANANVKPYLMKKESPIDHRVGKKQAFPVTYNQLIPKPRPSLPDTYKLKKQVDNLVHQQKMTPPNKVCQKTQSSSVAANANRKPYVMKRKSPIEHRPWLKLGISLADKEQKNYEKNIKMVSQSSNCFCGICFDFKSPSDMFQGSKCNHPFCNGCISMHGAAKIHQNVLKVNCPNPKCNMELKPEILKPILPKEVMVRWETAIYESSIASWQKFYCPFKNCSVLLVDDGNRGHVMTSSECPSCHRLFCVQCKVPWHAKMNCKEFQKWKRSQGEKDLDRKFLELAKRKMWQKCPKCSIYVQRCSGCEHMKCRCGCNFCYKCGKNWKFGHIC